MFKFDWGGAKNDSPSSEQNSPQNMASDSSPAVTEARAQANAELEASKKRRGRPRKDQTIGDGNRPALSEELKAEMRAQFDALYDPQAWGSLLAMPGDVALALTGNKDRWNITKEERTTLGVTGSAAARTMMITNPRSLAFLMLASALFSVYVPRATKELAEYRLRKSGKTEDKNAQSEKH